MDPVAAEGKPLAGPPRAGLGLVQQAEVEKIRPRSSTRAPRARAGLIEMDVRCPACEVEYEFDDDKVTAAGVTVKCTSCDHVFKVKKDGAAPALDLPAAQQSTDWMIRQRDGRTFKFKELTTLQKWIVEQKVGRDDHISRTGQHWKPLGEIAELASFFQVVDAARAAQQMASQPPGYPSMPPQGYPTPPGTPSPGSVPPHGAMPPGSVPPQAGYGYGQVPTFTPGSQPPAMAMPPGYPSPPHGAPNPMGHGSMGGAAVGQATGQFPPGHRPTLETVFDPGAMPIGDGMDEDDPVAQWQKRGRRRKVALLLVVALVAGAGGVYVTRPDLVAPLLERAGIVLGNQPVDAPAIVHAREALDDDDKALAQALDELEPLVAEQAPEALALASRLSTARARQARWQQLVAEIRALTSGTNATLEPGRQADALLSRGYELAGKAMATGAKNARLANADYQAARGAIAEMEADLKAGGPEGSNASEAAVVRVLGRARKVIDERTPASLEQLQAALGDPAVPKEDRRVLTAVLLAKVAAGVDAETLSADVKALQIIEGVGGVATAVAEALQKGPIALAPAGQPAPGDTRPTDATDAKPADDGAATKAPPTDPKPKVTYGTLVARGRNALMAGRSSSALSAFKKAEAARPGDPAAASGMGWAYLDLGKNSASIRMFKKALAKDPGWADAHLGLGEAYRADGNKPGAIKHFKKYLALKPNGEEASVAKRALKALE
jgi:predicted Zn finger-like uncharacterized protein